MADCAAVLAGLHFFDAEHLYGPTSSLNPAVILLVLHATMPSYSIVKHHPAAWTASIDLLDFFLAYSQALKLQAGQDYFFYKTAAIRKKLRLVIAFKTR